MKRMVKLLTICLIYIFVLDYNVYASNICDIIEVKIENDMLTLELQGIDGLVEKVNVLIGGTECKIISVKEPETLDTLLLWDNSLSVTQNSRKQIDEVIKSVLNNKKDKEAIGIATVGKGAELALDFTVSQNEIEEGYSNIQYAAKDSYSIDALYEAIELLKTRESKEYQKIIFFLENIDEKSLNHTWEELENYIEECKIPIYIISISGDGTDQIKEMVKKSGGAYYTLESLRENDNISSILQNRSIVESQIPEELLDGKSYDLEVEIKTDNSVYTVKDSILMSEVMTVPEEMPETLDIDDEPELIGADEVSASAETDEQTKAEMHIEQFLTIKYIGIAVVVIGIMLVGIVIGFFMIRKKSTQKFRELIDNPKEDIIKDDEPRTDKGINKRLIRQDTDTDRTQRLFEQTQAIPKENKLVIFDKYGKYGQIQKNFRKEISIGRSRQNDISLPEDKVSEVHCKIFYWNGVFYLKDMNSTNGTYMNGKRVVDEIIINSGCIIQVGDLEFQIELSDK